MQQPAKRLLETLPAITSWKESMNKRKIRRHKKRLTLLTFEDQMRCLDTIPPSWSECTTALQLLTHASRPASAATSIMERPTDSPRERGLFCSGHQGIQ